MSFLKGEKWLFLWRQFSSVKHFNKFSFFCFLPNVGDKESWFFKSIGLQIKKGKRNALSLKEEIFKNNKVMVTWSSPSRHYNCQENRLNDVFLLEDLHSGFFCIQLIHFVLPITLSHLSVLEIFAVGHMFRMVAKKWFFFYASQKSLAVLPEWWIANSPFSVVLLQSRDTRIEYQIIQAHKPLRILGLFGPMYHLKVRDTNGSVPVLFCYW